MNLQQEDQENGTVNEQENGINENERANYTDATEEGDDTDEVYDVPETEGIEETDADEEEDDISGDLAGNASNNEDSDDQ